MSSISNRVISIYNRKTSMRFLPIEWEAIDYICKQENITRKLLFELIDINRHSKISLTAAIRLFVVVYYKNKALKRTYYKKDNDEFSNAIFEALKEVV